MNCPTCNSADINVSAVPEAKKGESASLAVCQICGRRWMVPVADGETAAETAAPAAPLAFEDEPPPVPQPAYQPEKPQIHVNSIADTVEGRILPKRSAVKLLTTSAMFAALAFAVTYFIKLFNIPLVIYPPYSNFINFDAKDVIIAVCGFVLGPIYAVAVAFVVAFVEMVTISTTQIWGMLGNALSSAVFAGTAAFIYKKMRTVTGAAMGLIAAVMLTTDFMLLWNWLIVPIYLPQIPRSDVAKALMPFFLPFNLIKYGLNAGLALLIYKPVVSALRASKLIPTGDYNRSLKSTLFAVLIALASIAICVGAILFLKS